MLIAIGLDHVLPMINALICGLDNQEGCVSACICSCLSCFLCFTTGFGLLLAPFSQSLVYNHTNDYSNQKGYKHVGFLWVKVGLLFNPPCPS